MNSVDGMGYVTTRRPVRGPRVVLLAAVTVLAGMAAGCGYALSGDARALLPLTVVVVTLPLLIHFGASNDTRKVPLQLLREGDVLAVYMVYAEFANGVYADVRYLFRWVPASSATLNGDVLVVEAPFAVVEIMRNTIVFERRKEAPARLEVPLDPGCLAGVESFLQGM